MKVGFSLLLAFCLMGGVMAQKPLPASKIMKQAYTQASKENKNVMVIFHASWCGWCHRMDSIMNMPETKPLFDKSYVIKHLVVQEVKDKKDLENPGADKLMKKNGGENQGIPYFLIFDKKGNLLSDSRMPAKDKKGNAILSNVGCPAQPDEVTFFTGLLKKTSSLNNAELKLIDEKFTQKPTKR